LGAPSTAQGPEFHRREEQQGDREPDSPDGEFIESEYHGHAHPPWPRRPAQLKRRSAATVLTISNDERNQLALDKQ
jgi:hypothetical protein